MKAYIVNAMIIVIVFTITIQPALAFTHIAIPFVTTDSAFFMMPVIASDLVVMEFNQSQCATSHKASLDISSPVFSDGLHLGPTVFNDGTFSGPDSSVTGLTSANELPFGTVNLAFPSIRQSVNDSMSCERTYFFSDTLGA